MAVGERPVADLFVKDLVEGITQGFPNQIDFILLAGSAARGDFEKGKSDIDLTIFLKRPEDLKRVQEAGRRMFWRLDRKHGMGLRDLYARKDPGQDHSRTLPVPVRAPGPRGGRSLFNRLDPLIGYSRALTRHAKISGRIVYGRDVLRDIRIKHQKPYDILFTYDLFLSMAGLLLFPLDPDKSLWRAVRALLFTFEDKLDDRDDRCHMLAMEAQQAKKDFDKIKGDWGLARKAAYCLKAPFHIGRSNIANLAEHLRGGGV